MRFALPPTLLAIAVSLTACGSSNSPGSPSGSDDPNAPPYAPPPPGGAAQGDHNLARLIAQFPEAKTKKPLWAGSWFPYSSGGTSQALSKYERATSKSGAVGWENSHHGPQGAGDWWGHCNGWSAASALFDEPRAPKTIQGVEFSVADQKALLTEIGMEVTADFFGTRSDVAGDTSSSSFQDVAPNQFFLVLTNYFAQGFTVIMDRYAGNQVWNHPIAGYRFAPIHASDSLGPVPGEQGLHRVQVSAQVWWVRDDVEPGHLTEPFAFQDGGSYQSRTYRFELWLDSPPSFNSAGEMTSSGDVVVLKQGGFVVGGQWTTPNLRPVDSHPDYLWVPKQVIPSNGSSNPLLDLNWVVQNFGRSS